MVSFMKKISCHLNFRKVCELWEILKCGSQCCLIFFRQVGVLHVLFVCSLEQIHFGLDFTVTCQRVSKVSSVLYGVEHKILFKKKFWKLLIFVWWICFRTEKFIICPGPNFYGTCLIEIHCYFFKYIRLTEIIRHISRNFERV